MRVTSVAILLLFTITMLAQDMPASPAAESLQRGVEYFDKGELARSLDVFSALAMANPGDSIARFNTLTLQAMTKKLQDAEKILEENPNLTDLEPGERSNAFYNLGTSYLNIANANDQAGTLMNAVMETQKAVEYLQRSLLENPDNFEAKNNLEIANRLLEKLQQQQENQDQNQDGENSEEGNKNQDSKEKQNQDDQQEKEKDSDQQDQQDKQQDEKQQNNQDQQNQQQQPQEQQKKQDQRSISKETAKNLLDSAKEKEKQALQAIRAMKAKQKKSKSEKDY